MEKVFASFTVTQPDPYSSSVSDGDLVASNLELQYLEYPLERVHVHSKKVQAKHSAHYCKSLNLGKAQIAQLKVKA